MTVVAIVIAIIVGLAAFGAWIMMLLWNWIMPYLFNLPTISFWMAWGIMLLVGFIFGGIHTTWRK